MAVHVMQDIETWGTGNDALPISIGAVKFDGDSIVDKFHVGIDPVDAQRYGRQIDAGTVLWWVDKDRRDALDAWLILPKVDLFAALDGFAQWVLQTPADDLGSLWGNGATFDNVILRSAYAAAGLDYPVKFFKDECYRTIKNRMKGVEFVRVGTHHSAVDDAASQAIHLQGIAKKFGWEL